MNIYPSKEELAVVEDAAVNIFPQSKAKAKLHVDLYIARYLQRLVDRQPLPATQPEEVDFVFRNQGSIFLIVPQNQNAAGHLRATSSTAPWQWIGEALIVDHRYARDTATRLQAAGFKVA